MALEAELIYAVASRGISWADAQEMELWELASALGLHRIETRAERDNREIVETKQAYWKETSDLRADKLKGYTKRRQQRARERARERQRQREEKKMKGGTI